MNTQNLKLVIQALRFPKHKWARTLVARQEDGTLCYCAVAQAYEALGGELEERPKHDGKFNSINCCDFVDQATGVNELGYRLVELNLQLSLPEIAELLAQEYSL